MKQGTISVLIGVHSPVHSILVVISWRKLYGKFPELWQIACIFLHDVGHWGLNYLDSHDAKKQHWRGGAYIAYWLFGERGYEFVAGHCSSSWYPRNQLYYADKHSWYIAPRWWLYWNSFVEPQLNCGMPTRKAVREFQAQVKLSVESGEYRSTHSMYLGRYKERTV